GFDPLEVGLEGDAAVAATRAGQRLGALVRLVDPGVELGELVRHRGHGRGIEVDVDADGTAVRRAETRELSEEPLGHDRGHAAVLTGSAGSSPRERPAALCRLLLRDKDSK